MDQDATWYGGTPRPRRHCVRWRSSCPPQKKKKRGTAAPCFSSHVYIVDKRSPISATACLNLRSLFVSFDHWTVRDHNPNHILPKCNQLFSCIHLVTIPTITCNLFFTRLHDTIGCQTGCQTVECLHTRYNRFVDDRFDNRLYRVNGAFELFYSQTDKQATRQTTAEAVSHPEVTDVKRQR